MNIPLYQADVGLNGNYTVDSGPSVGESGVKTCFGGQPWSQWIDNTGNAWSLSTSGVVGQITGASGGPLERIVGIVLDLDSWFSYGEMVPVGIGESGATYQMPLNASSGGSLLVSASDVPALPTRCLLAGSAWGPSVAPTASPNQGNYQWAYGVGMVPQAAGSLTGMHPFPQPSTGVTRTYIAVLSNGDIMQLGHTRYEPQRWSITSNVQILQGLPDIPLGIDLPTAIGNRG